ncbi:hypothetical protein JXD38_06960 [candidate division WOR-3 bacterium]|nr:hypothetical protein [candidate division WOR-3 bacterium]
MRKLSALVVLIVALACFSLMACDALRIVDVTLDITGDNLSYFTGYYETTGSDTTAISGTVPKSYTFQARKSLDVVAVQIVRVGVGQISARLIADGITRDSAATSDVVGVITLEWIAK